MTEISARPTVLTQPGSCGRKAYLAFELTETPSGAVVTRLLRTGWSDPALKAPQFQMMGSSMNSEARASDVAQEGSPNMSELKRLYVWEDPGVDGVIARHSFLTQLLLEAAQQIRRQFESAHIALRTEARSTTGECVVASITPNCDEGTIGRYYSFIENWWAPRLQSGQMRLFFDLE